MNRAYQIPDCASLLAVPGDVVIYEGSEWVVDQVGIRYYVAHTAHRPLYPAMLKRGLCVKVTPAVEPEAPYIEQKPIPLVSRR
jgi:hypothetical protein